MTLRNATLQKWREAARTSDTPREGRLSVPYHIPSRSPMHWFARPRALQARYAQLLSGRSHTQQYLSIIDPTQYSSHCPLGDGEGTLEHYLTVCTASRQWRLKLLEKYLESEHEPDFLGERRQCVVVEDEHARTVGSPADHSAHRATDAAQWAGGRLESGARASAGR